VFAVVDDQNSAVAGRDELTQKEIKHMRLVPCRQIGCYLFVFALLVVCAPSIETITPPASGQEVQAVKSKARLELIGRLQRKPGGAVGHLTVADKRVYLVNEDAGLQLVDVSNPAAPKVVGAYKPKDSLGPVAASGDHAFVVEKDDRVRVLDVSNPARPRPVGLCQLPDQVCGLAVAGKHVYASLSDSLHILDISDLAQPKEMGACGDLELAGRVSVAGKYAYVAADFNGMRIIDVSDSAKPKEIGSFEGPGNVTKIAILDRYAYLADYSGGLYIVDISNPKKPKQVGRHGDYVVGDVAVVGTYALLAAGSLDVIDVSKPSHPTVAGGIADKDCDTAWSVAVAGEYVYTISDAGLFVFRLRPKATPK
jgi:hypothetical protein